jgi:hypothetical protein
MACGDRAQRTAGGLSPGRARGHCERRARRTRPQGAERLEPQAEPLRGTVGNVEVVGRQIGSGGSRDAPTRRLGPKSRPAGRRPMSGRRLRRSRKPKRAQRRAGTLHGGRRQPTGRVLQEPCPLRGILAAGAAARPDRCSPDWSEAEGGSRARDRSEESATESWRETCRWGLPRCGVERGKGQRAKPDIKIRPTIRVKTVTPRNHSSSRKSTSSSRRLNRSMMSFSRVKDVPSSRITEGLTRTRVIARFPPNANWAM